MKKVLLIMALFMGICSISHAEPLKIGEVLEKFSDVALEQGIAYNVTDSKINYLSTIEIAKISDKISIEGGYVGSSSEEQGHGVALVVSLDLLELKDYIDVPILNLIKFQPGFFVGFTSINGHRIMESEEIWGPSVSLISFSW